MSKSTIFVFFMLAVLSCSKKEPTNNQEKYSDPNLVSLTEAQAKNVKISFCKIEKREFNHEITVTGMLHVPPQNLVSIAAVGGGYIKNTSLLPGSKVYKGQTIATIQNLDYITLQQDFLEAKNKFEYIERDYQRQQTLSSENIVSSQALQLVTSDYKSIKTKVRALEEKLLAFGFIPSKITSENISHSVDIFSPINGYVTKVNVNIGKYVTPSDVLFEIANTEHLHIELSVFEKDIHFLKKGQKIKVTLADGSSVRNAYIHLIGREIAPDRTVAVHAHLDKEDPELIPGMYIKAVIESNHKTSYCLPEQAICFSGNERIVFISKDKNIYQAIKVQTGNTDEGYTEIDLLDNDPLITNQVVCEGNYSLLSKKDNIEAE